MKIGFWLGYSGVVRFEHEGIGRMNYFLIENFLEYYPENSVEIWLPSYLNPYVNYLIPLIDKYPDRLLFYNEDIKQGSNEQRLKDLISVCNRESQCDLFIIPIIILESGLFLNFKRLVMAYDMIPTYLIKTFGTLEYPEYIDASNRGIEMSNKYADQENVWYSCNSNYIRVEHFLKYTRINPRKIKGIMPAPLNKTFNKVENIKYGKPYVIYPTRIRSKYKNAQVILKAIRDLDIYCVFTSKIPEWLEKDFLPVKNKIKFEIDVTNERLHSLYKDSLCTIAPSYVEGAFPAPAYEGLQAGVPIIISNTGFAREWLSELPCLSFEPEDCEGLKSCIEFVLKNRDRVLKDQKPLRDKVKKYTWKQAIKKYYTYLEEIVND